MTVDPTVNACEVLVEYCASRPSGDWLQQATVTDGVGSYQCNTCPNIAPVTPSTAGNSEALSTATHATHYRWLFVAAFLGVVGLLFGIATVKGPKSLKPSVPRTWWQAVDKVTGYTDRDLLPLPFLLHAANNHPLVGLLAERCGLQRMILSRTMRSRVILQNLVLALAMNIVFAGAKLAGTVDTSCTYTSTGPGSHSMSSGSTSDFSGVLSAKLQKTMVGSVVVMACMLPTGMAVDALAEVAQRWRLCPCGVVAELAAVVLLTAAVAAEILMQVSGTALGIKIVLYVGPARRGYTLPVLLLDWAPGNGFHCAPSCQVDM